jgi:hypothetical protein
VGQTDKNLLFDRKSIKGGKDRVKQKIRTKGRETRETPEENGTIQVGILQIEGNKRKRRSRLPKFRHAAPFTSRSSFISNGGVIFGGPESLINGHPHKK